MPSSQSLQRTQLAPVLLAMVVVVAYTAILSAMRFHVCLNDFWAWRFLAEHSTLQDVKTLQNGFMPPAYVLFLKALGPGADLAGAFLLNGISVVAALHGLTVLSRSTGLQGAAWLAVALSAVWPPFLQSALTAGPDIVSAALVALAAGLHWAPHRTTRRSLIAGVLVGLALLVRGHALVAGLALVAAPLLFERRLDRGAAWMLAGIGGGVVLQAALNLAAGVAPWDSGQAFNVYKMVRGVDWYNPVQPASISVPGLMLEDPLHFLKEWAGAFRRLGQWLLGPLFAWWWARRCGRPDLARIAGYGFIAGLFYCIPVSLGDSPRAAVTVGAILLAPVAGLLVALREDGPGPVPLLLALIIGFGIAESVRSDREFLGHNLRQSRDFACVEARLLERGVESASEVFTDDFDLYFRKLDGRRPVTRGGWGVIGIRGWTQVYPQLPTEEPAIFLDACRTEGIRFLALTRKSRRLGSDFAKLRYDALAAGAEPIGECGEFILVSVPPQP